MAKRKIDPYDLPGFEALPAVVVADTRSKMGLRLGSFALVLLVFFFAVSSYIQSANNGEALERASRDRSRLSEAIQQALDQQAEDRTIILTFGAIIAEQNRRLTEAGLDPVEIMPLRPLPEQIPNPETPPDDDSNDISSSEANPPASLPGAPEGSPFRNIPPLAPRASTQPTPTPRPEPEPEPEETSDIPLVGQLICNLTDICL